MSSAGTAKVPVLSAGDNERGAAYHEQGWWQTRTLPSYLDEFIASGPDRLFVTDGTRSLSYAQVGGGASRFGARPRELGVRRGDRVVVQLPNWAEFVIAYLALTRIGAVTVPVMPIYRHNEVEYVLRHSEAVAAVTCDSFRGFGYRQMYAALRPAAPDLRHV